MANDELAIGLRAVHHSPYTLVTRAVARSLERMTEAGDVAMRIIVTGGAGFIGSHTCERLVEAAHETLVIDDLSSGVPSNLASVSDRLEFEQLDIRDRARLRRAVAAWRPEAILHLAAIVSAPLSIEEPLQTASVNLCGSLELLEAARLAAVRRVVAASSAAVYGPEPALPSRETDSPMPVSPYAAQKLALEQHLAVYSAVYGLQTLALRYFNVYGPRQLPTNPYSGVISILLDCLMNGRPFPVNGDGAQTRDYVSVFDVALINQRALEAPSLPHQVINVGCGISSSLHDLIVVAESCLGQRPEIAFRPARLGDIPHSRASIERLRELIDATTLRPVAKGLCDLLHGRVVG